MYCDYCDGRGYFHDLEDSWPCKQCGGKGVSLLRVFASLREANTARQALWGGDQQDGMYRAVELGGEVGEVLNVVKKLERERLGLPGSRATNADLEDELGDAMICLDLLAKKYGINLDQAAARKFNKTSEKMGFDVRLFVPPPLEPK